MTIDDKLIKAIKKNDDRIILGLYEYTYDKIMSVTVRYYANEEDRVTIVNNSFMKILDNIDQFKLGSSYFSWVNRIVYNEIINAHRKEKRNKMMFNFEVYDIAIDTFQDSALDEGEMLEEKELLQMISELPKATRIVFDMYAVEGGYTYKEVAEFLDISSETVKWHLKQARRLLKEMIKKHNLHEYAS